MSESENIKSVKLSTLADALGGGDSDEDHTPEELYITTPPPRRGKRNSLALALEGPRGGAAGSARAAAAARRRKDASTKTEKFPTHEAMMLLPPEIRSTLLELVMDYFKRKIYPRLVFLSRRKQRRHAVEQARVTAPTVSVGFLQAVPLFARWPGLDSVVRSMRLVVLERGTLLTHEGDQSPVGVFFLVHGTLQGRVKRPASQLQTVPGYPAGIVRGINLKPVSRKSLGPNNTTVTTTYEAPVCYGEMSLLTEEPRLESLRALTRCLVWVLDRTAFFSHLNSLPPDRRAAVTEVAFQQRRENIPRVFPVTGATLNRVSLFNHIPVDRLDVLAPRLEPRVFQEGQVICNIGDVGTEMYLIVRGQMNVSVVSSDIHRDGSEPVSPGGQTSAVGSVETVSGPGSVVGEMSVLFSQKRNCQLIALTTCDVYAMTRDMIVQAVTNTKQMTLLLQKAHSIQAERQKNAKSRFLDYIKQIPLLASELTKPLEQALLDSFSSKVYPPHTTVITVSEVADRLVIVIRGKARVTATSRDMLLGECVGYTCLIPHRWCHHVVALDTVETIELGCEAFLKICKAHGVFKRLKALTLGLLYPRVYPDEFAEAYTMVKDLPGPLPFPSSEDYEVKPFAARVTEKPSLPLIGGKRRQRTTATGLVLASREEAQALAPPRHSAVQQAVHAAAVVSDDDDNDLAAASSTYHPGLRRGRSQSRIERRDDGPAGDTASPDVDGDRRNDAAPADEASPSKSDRAGKRSKSGVDYSALASQQRQRNRQAEIERLANKIKELQRKGVTMAGSPARSVGRRKQNVSDASSAPRSSSPSPAKAAAPDNKEEGTPASSPAKAAQESKTDEATATAESAPPPTAPVPAASATPAKQQRTVGLQTTKSYLMTRYRKAQQKHGSTAAAKAAADTEGSVFEPVDPASLPDNCGAEVAGAPAAARDNQPPEASPDGAGDEADAPTATAAADAADEPARADGAAEEPAEEAADKPAEEHSEATPPQTNGGGEKPPEDRTAEVNASEADAEQDAAASAE